MSEKCQNGLMHCNKQNPYITSSAQVERLGRASAENLRLG